MSLYEKIQEDTNNAMRARDARKLGVLRMMVSEMKYKMIDAGGSLSDELAISVLQKEAKKRQESIEIYKKANDAARTEQEEYELGVINEYLPTLMSEAEVTAEVEKIAAGTDKRGGMLIGEVKKVLGNKADGSVIAKVVMSKYGK